MLWLRWLLSLFVVVAAVAVVAAVVVVAAAAAVVVVVVAVPAGVAVAVAVVVVVAVLVVVFTTVGVDAVVVARWFDGVFVLVCCSFGRLVCRPVVLVVRCCWWGGGWFARGCPICCATIGGLLHCAAFDRRLGRCVFVICRGGLCLLFG